MLRNTLLAVALLVACTGIVLWVVADQSQAFPVALWGTVLFVLIVLERWRYRHVAENNPAQWQATDEQFIDPESGRLTRVFYNPVNGERRYVVVDDQ